MPALTFWVSADLALANFLASRSFGNVSVALACVLFLGPSSNETYHVPLDLRAMMRRSRRYAGGSPSATSRNFSEFCISPSVTSRTSIEGRPDSFRAASDPDHPPALRIRFPRWPRGQKVSREGRLRPQLGGSWGRSLEVPVREAGTISNVVSQSAETIKFYFRIQEWPVLNLRVA